MADWTRRFDSSYRFMRVSRATGLETGRLPGFQPGGSIERNLDTELKESGSVGHVGALDVGSDLVRVWMDARFPVGGGVESVALGTFLPSVSSRSYDGIASTSTVKLEGRLKELAQSDFPQPFMLPAGTDLVAYAAQIAEGAGLAVEADASPYRSTVPLYYGLQTGENEADASGSKLAVVNDLLARAGFDSARTDPMGTVLMRKTLGIAERKPVWAFAEGRSARFLRGITDERDTSGVANVVYCVFTGAAEDGGEQETVVGYAIDDDPSSPWSVQALGREVVARYDYNEYADQNAANAKAREMLDSTRSVKRVVTVSHVYAPIAPADAVQVAYASGGVRETMGVRTMRLQLVDGCLTETEMRAYGRA